MRVFISLLIGGAVLFAVGCGGTAEPAARPTNTPSPRAASELTPAPTAAVAATATIPTPTATAEPPAPEPPTEPEPEPEPTATEPPPAPTWTPEPPAPAPTQPPPPPPTSTPPPPPAPSGPASFTVTAQGLRFSPATLSASAGSSVTITMNNLDTFIPHDIVVSGYGGTQTCTGPCSRSFTFTPAAGTYQFVCTVHPNMVGTLIVN